MSLVKRTQELLDKGYSPKDAIRIASSEDDSVVRFNVNQFQRIASFTVKTEDGDKTFEGVVNE